MRLSLLVVVFLMPVLWASSVILMRQSQLRTASRGEDASMVALLEFVKLLAALSLYTTDTVMQGSDPVFSFSWRWAIPALCYALINCLTYITIDLAGTTRYALLSHLKIVPTALLAHIALSKPLTRLQWVAVACMGMGLVVNDYSGSDNWIGDLSGGVFALSVGMALLSACGSVYSEYVWRRIVCVCVCVCVCVLCYLCVCQTFIIAKSSFLDTFSRQIQLITYYLKTPKCTLLARSSRLHCSPLWDSAFQPHFCQTLMCTPPCQLSSK
jgi:drug/metabolite transporter (DMT)-like permease